MNAPQSFVKRLDAMFHGRLRIRWSDVDQEWRIEQKVGNATVAPIKYDGGRERDDLICARDGYAYVLTVRTGDRMPCPVCQFAVLRVPVRDFVDVQCAYCASRGHEGRTVVGFWPLDDLLIDHLRKLDPEGDYSRRLAADVDAHNLSRDDALERKMSNETYAAGADHYNEMVGISQFGYSKATSWPTRSL